MFISFVLAAYNEEENVKILTQQILEETKKLKVPFEIIYIIDGKDNTYSILKDMKKEYKLKNMILIHNRKRQGFANAFKQGFGKISSKATHIITMDCDLNHDPKELYKFIIESNKGTDIVIGSREVKGGKTIGIPKWKRLVSLFANYVFLLITPLKVLHKSSGYRLIKREVIDSVAFSCKSNNFEYLLEFLLIANKLGYKIKEVPITFTYRIHGKTKFKLISTGLGYAKLMLKNLF